jgi:hypothetical protein
MAELQGVRYSSPADGAPDRHQFVATTSWGAVTFTFDPQVSTTQPVQIAIDPVEDGALPPEALRRLGLTALRNATITNADRPVVKWLAGIHPASDEPWLTSPRPGRRGREDRDYALWAKRYVEANEESSHPIKKMTADHPGHSAEMLRAILNKARKRGLLTESPKGRAGGWLTKKAEALLGETESG